MASSFISNFASSVKTLGVEWLKGSNPALKEIYDGLKEIKSKEEYPMTALGSLINTEIPKTIRTIRQDMIDPAQAAAIKQGMNRFKANLRQGKFIADEVANDMGDFGDISFDFDSFDESSYDNGGSSGSSESSDEVKVTSPPVDPENLITQGDKLVASSFTQMTRAAAEQTTAEIRMNTMAIHSALGGIQKSVRGLAEIVVTASRAQMVHYQKSDERQLKIQEMNSRYQSGVITGLSESNVYLKEIASAMKTQLEMYGLTTTGKAIGASVSAASATGKALYRSGQVSAEALLERITKGAKIDLSTLTELLSDPSATIQGAFEQFVIPKKLTKAMANLDDTIESLGTLALLNLNSKIDSMDSGTMKGKVAKFLQGRFGLKAGVKAFDLSSGHTASSKNAVKFDGIFYNTVVKEIPFYLKGLYGAANKLSPKDEPVFDHATGKFRSTGSIISALNQTRKTVASGQSISTLKRELMAQFKGASKEQKQLVGEEFEKALNQLAGRGSLYKGDLSTDVVDKNVQTAMNETFKKMSYTKQRQFQQEMLKHRESLEKRGNVMKDPLGGLVYQKATQELGMHEQQAVDRLQQEISGLTGLIKSLEGNSPEKTAASNRLFKLQMEAKQQAQDRSFGLLDINTINRGGGRNPSGRSETAAARRVEQLAGLKYQPAGISDTETLADRQREELDANGSWKDIRTVTGALDKVTDSLNALFFGSRKKPASDGGTPPAPPQAPPTPPTPQPPVNPNQNDEPKLQPPQPQPPKQEQSPEGEPKPSGKPEGDSSKQKSSPEEDVQAVDDLLDSGPGGSRFGKLGDAARRMILQIQSASVLGMARSLAEVTGRTIFGGAGGAMGFGGSGGLIGLLKGTKSYKQIQSQFETIQGKIAQSGGIFGMIQSLEYYNKIREKYLIGKEYLKEKFKTTVESSSLWITKMFNKQNGVFWKKKELFKGWFKETIGNPLKDAMGPIKDYSKAMATQLWAKFSDSFYNVKGAAQKKLNALFAEKFGKPFGDIMQERLIVPLDKITGRLKTNVIKYLGGMVQKGMGVVRRMGVSASSKLKGMGALDEHGKFSAKNLRSDDYYRRGIAKKIGGLKYEPYIPINYDTDELHDLWKKPKDTIVRELRLQNIIKVPKESDGTPTGPGTPKSEEGTPVPVGKPTDARKTTESDKSGSESPAGIKKGAEDAEGTPRPAESSPIVSEQVKQTEQLVKIAEATTKQAESENGEAAALIPSIDKGVSDVASESSKSTRLLESILNELFQANRLLDGIAMILAQGGGFVGGEGGGPKKPWTFGGMVKSTIKSPFKLMAGGYRFGSSALGSLRKHLTGGRGFARMIGGNVGAILGGLGRGAGSILGAVGKAGGILGTRLETVLPWLLEQGLDIGGKVANVGVGAAKKLGRAGSKTIGWGFDKASALTGYAADLAERGIKGLPGALSNAGSLIGKAGVAGKNMLGKVGGAIPGVISGVGSILGGGMGMLGTAGSLGLKGLKLGSTFLTHGISGVVGGKGGFGSGKVQDVNIVGSIALPTFAGSDRPYDPKFRKSTASQDGNGVMEKSASFRDKWEKRVGDRFTSSPMKKLTKMIGKLPGVGVVKGGLSSIAGRIGPAIMGFLPIVGGAIMAALPAIGSALAGLGIAKLVSKILPDSVKTGMGGSLADSVTGNEVAKAEQLNQKQIAEKFKPRISKGAWGEIGGDSDFTIQKLTAAINDKKIVRIGQGPESKYVLASEAGTSGNGPAKPIETAGKMSKDVQKYWDEFYKTNKITKEDTGNFELEMPKLQATHDRLSGGGDVPAIGSSGPEMTARIMNWLAGHEGWGKQVYLDSRGFKTIGIGHLVTPKDPWKNIGDPISDEDTIRLFISDFHKHYAMAKRAFPTMDAMNPIQQAAMMGMFYQMGDKARKWKHFSSAIDRKDWAGAAKAGGQSLWAREQTPERAAEVLKMLGTGDPSFMKPRDVAVYNARPNGSTKRIKSVSNLFTAQNIGSGASVLSKSLEKASASAEKSSGSGAAEDTSVSKGVPVLSKSSDREPTKFESKHPANVLGKGSESSGVKAPVPVPASERSSGNEVAPEPVNFPKERPSGSKPNIIMPESSPEAPEPTISKKTEASIGSAPTIDAAQMGRLVDGVEKSAGFLEKLVSMVGQIFEIASRMNSGSAGSEKKEPVKGESPQEFVRGHLSGFNTDTMTSMIRDGQDISSRLRATIRSYQ